MNYEKETLQLLRKSLDQEEDETSIIPILQNHHKYIKEYLNILSNPESHPDDKRSTAGLFITIFTMHAVAEEQSLYRALQKSLNQEVRTLGLKNCDNNEIAFQIISELKELRCEHMWSEEIDAKISILNSFLNLHVKEEESVLFPIAEKHLSEAQLMDLADDYLDYCKIRLDMNMEVTPSEVSRSDVMTFLY